MTTNRQTKPPKNEAILGQFRTKSDNLRPNWFQICTKQSHFNSGLFALDFGLLCQNKAKLRNEPKKRNEAKSFLHNHCNR